jgi:uncharacterized protein (DUF1800 family)
VLRHPSGLTPKLKRPVHVVASTLRMLGAATNGGAPIQAHLANMGQPLFAWPTPDGPPDERSAWQTGLFARWAFAYQAARNEIEGTEIDVPALLTAAGVRGAADGFDALANAVLGSRLDPPQREAILRLGSKVPDDEVAPLFLAGLLASPAFQHR